MVDEVGSRGGTLVLRGAAGIGKSALLEVVAERAHELGATVVTATGSQSEARFAFGGLHQLLLPFLDRLDRLPGPQRRALNVAFGVAEGHAPDVFLIGLATLGVVTEGATTSPLLLVVDDAQWLDRSSAEVLAFVARRLDLEPVILLLAVRDGIPSALDEADLSELSVAGLDDEASRALLDVNGAALTPGLQRRILAEAAGNPLALLELPTAVEGLEMRMASEPLPLTARLEAAFAAKLTTLDPVVRTLLLLAALDDGELTELSGAAQELLGVSIGVDGWTMAAASGLGTLDAGRFRFRHPLMRSAVHQAATGEQRRQAHAALGRTLADDPDRAVWRQAAAAERPDQRVASALYAAADRARSRGGLGDAFAALERAAALTTDPQRRALRLAEAGELAWELGRSDESVPLLRAALQLGLPADQSVRTSFFLETLTNAWSGASTIPRFARIAEELAAGGDDRRALEAIDPSAGRAHPGPLDTSTRQHVSAIVERLAVPVEDPVRLAALALIDPIHRGKEVIQRVSRMSPVGIVKGDQLFAVGRAASAVWADNLALPFFRSAVAAFRADGRLSQLCQALAYEAWTNLHHGAVRVAIPEAAEAARIAEEARHVRFVPTAKLAHAIAAAGLGEEETAERLIDEAEASLLAMGANPLLAMVALARGRSALAAERPGEAYTDLIRIFTTTDAAYQPFVRGWAIADLVDAAVRGDGDIDRVRGLLSAWQQIAADTKAPHLEVQLAYAAALLADDATADERFQVAMTSGAAGWPVYAARAQLAYGGWLRRQRRDTEARVPLREAAQVFDALGQRRFADRALRELRASGERARRRVPEAWTELSPQELQIAQLAAGGLSNREIGERLYLSHRTVGTHLYRLFPKLGITARAQLRDALEAPRHQ
jgi:DNA-binding CsgD family transcriptional regulator/tetratricopeptide (TPR) repeat protein